MGDFDIPDNILDCPPTEAHSDDVELFVLVKSVPLSDDDWRPLLGHEKRPLRDDQKCQAAGLSCYTDVEDARNTLQFPSHLGKKVAQLSFCERLGLVMPTPQFDRPSHHTFWAKTGVDYRNELRGAPDV